MAAVSAGAAIGGEDGGTGRDACDGSKGLAEQGGKSVCAGASAGVARGSSERDGGSNRV